MNWLKQQAANIAGTAEPEYGPSAIRTVTAQPKNYTEIGNDNLKWIGMESTCVETQCFYFVNDEGQHMMCQFIYSNVAGIKTTCQFTSKIFHHDGPNQNLWCSDQINGHRFDATRLQFQSEHANSVVSEDGKTITVKSDISAENTVEFVLTRTAPAFVAGENGYTYYGTDPKKPWGSMIHNFWPRCTVTGTMTTKKKTYSLNGRAAFIKALQGMKPHHAAASWNFINFQSPQYSAILMEFTTPISYGKTVVSVGGIAKDGEIIYAGAANQVSHLAIQEDKEAGWHEPKAIMVKWNTDGKQAVSAEISGDLGQKIDRVDVLAHVPTIIKNLLGGIVGTKPIIYQYAFNNKLPLVIKGPDGEHTEQGTWFSEATFIC